MKTKTIFIFLIAAVPLIFLTSCEKVKDLASVNVSYDLPDLYFQYVPAMYKDGEVILYSGALQVNLDSILNANGLSSGFVGATTFSQFSVTIEQPENANFGWLKSARAVVSQNSSFDPQAQIGSVVNSDPVAKTVTLTLNNVNIRPYLGTSNFYLTLYAELTGPVPYEWINMYASSQLRMVLEPLN
jgi:hypothetical protein